MVCEYGCKQEAKYQFKNGKWCCSQKVNGCLGYRTKISNKLVGIKRSEQTKAKQSKYAKNRTNEHKKKLSESISKTFKIICNTEKYKDIFSKRMMGRIPPNKGKRKKLYIPILSKEGKILCDYGCGEEANFTFKNGKHCCSSHASKCFNIRGRIKKQLIGKHIHSEKGKEERRQRMLNGLGSYARSFRGPMSDKEKNQKRVMMKNGQAARMNKFIKNPSKPELQLRVIIKELYPESEHTYPILNYAVDDALLEYKIAIEFDGYFHFCDQEHIDYHNKRQKEIEEDGWKFLRYNIYQKFPTKEQIQKDIQNLIENKNLEIERMETT